MKAIVHNLNQTKINTHKNKASILIEANLHQQAFNNTPQAQLIITPENGKIILANKAAGKLFGYSKKELLTKRRSDIFDINEQEFKKMLKQRTVEGNSVALVTAIKRTGKKILCEITSALFIGDDGIRKAIYTIADRSKHILEQKNIDAKKDKVVASNIAAAISAQQNIDTRKEKIVASNIAHAKILQRKIDIKKDKIVADNIALAITVQHTIDVKKDKVVAANILSAVTEQRAVDVLKDKVVAHNIALAKKEQKKIDKQQAKIVASNIIIALAKSDDEKLEQGIAAKAAYKADSRLLINSSSDVLYDIDLITNEVVISDAYEKEFGYKVDGNMASEVVWSKHIHPQDKDAMLKDYDKTLASNNTKWQYNYRFIKADNSIITVSTSNIMFKNADGKTYRIIGSMRDVSKEKLLEEKLECEIQLKEQQIAEAMIEAKEAERSDIGKELHDNVNQLLGASKLYLEMAKRGGAESEMYLSRSTQYTLDAIEEIRKLTKGLNTDIIERIGLCEAIENIIFDTMETSTVTILSEMKSFKENIANEKFKLNIFRIVQEQLNNILKHAKATKVNISLSEKPTFIELKISDNGVGFDTTKKRSGIGVSNIKQRVNIYNGTSAFKSSPGKGCVLSIVFPITEDMRASG